jgi:hypothetical protein
MIKFDVVDSMVGRVIPLGLAYILAGCGPSEARPPPLRQEQTCPYDDAAACHAPQIPDAAVVRSDAVARSDAQPGAGGGAGCDLGLRTEPRDGPAVGHVAELDETWLSLRAAPVLGYYGTTPLGSGSVKVEIDAPGCSLATGMANADGSFSIDGTAANDVSVRLVPIDRDDLITTIHQLGTDPRLEYPILTRAALAKIIAALDPALKPEPDKAQVIVNFILKYTGAPLAEATFSSGTNGTILYDGGGMAGGPDGLGVSVNGTAKPYPGNMTSVTIHNLNGTKQDQHVGVAQDAVSFVHAEP